MVTDRGQMAALMRRAGERMPRPSAPDPERPTTDLEARERAALRLGSALPTTPEALLSVLCEEIRKWASFRISVEQEQDGKTDEAPRRHHTYEHLLERDRRTSALHHKRATEAVRDASTQIAALSAVSTRSKAPAGFLSDVRSELTAAAQALVSLEKESNRIRERWSATTTEIIEMLRSEAAQLDEKRRALRDRMTAKRDEEEAALWQRVSAAQSTHQKEVSSLTAVADEHAAEVEICISGACELMERVTRASDSSDTATHEILTSTLARLSSTRARCSMLRSGMLEDAKDTPGLNLVESTYATLQRINSIIRLIGTMSEVMAIDVPAGAADELVSARRQREDAQRALMNAEKELADAQAGCDALYEAHKALQASGSADVATATKMATLSSRVRLASEGIVGMTESVRRLRTQLSLRSKDVEMAQLPQLMERLSKLHTRMAAQLLPLKTVYRHLRRVYASLQALDRDRTHILRELRGITTQDIETVYRRTASRLAHEAEVASAEIQRVWVSCAEEEDRAIAKAQAALHDHTSTAKRRTRSIIVEDHPSIGDAECRRLSDYVAEAVGRFVLALRPIWQDRALAAIALLRGLVSKSLMCLDYGSA